MTVKLEADGVHFYCSSPEVTRKLIERGARIVGQCRAEDPRRAVQPTKRRTVLIPQTRRHLGAEE